MTMLMMMVMMMMMIDVSETDEGAYVDTVGHVTRNSVLQWGEMPTSIGMLKLTNILLAKCGCCHAGPCAITDNVASISTITGDFDTWPAYEVVAISLDIWHKGTTCPRQ